MSIVRLNPEDSPSGPLWRKLGDVRLNDSTVDIGCLMDEYGILLRVLETRLKVVELLGILSGGQ